ncbi:uncharacterized protein LY89DRAFT_686428 [Mollisia scopiformis]|uniref:Uncharacterized protein n=1 Tax=Mollisia scopiformis TaxID=149040 RepID=A0A194X3K3_MOLSC|nr:uncharacterized protein LY89DRAFT_686428 [Mollisia scopiformis]KUJ14773.1 hypothetical protein LY89DRAFT_686428 [Mollisia scopiformis]
MSSSSSSSSSGVGSGCTATLQCDVLAGTYVVPSHESEPATACHPCAAGKGSTRLFLTAVCWSRGTVPVFTPTLSYPASYLPPIDRVRSLSLSLSLEASAGKMNTL